MAGSGIGIKVSGDKAARAALLAAAGQLQGEVAAVHKQAARMIEQDTRSMMGDQMVTSDRSGRLERSIKGTGTATEIKVTLGNRSTPYAGWWEFGGFTKSPIGNTNREIVPGGRSLYPSVAKNRTAIYAMLDRVARRVAETIVGFK